MAQVSGTLLVQLPPYLDLQSLIGRLQIVHLESTNHRERRKQATLNKLKCVSSGLASMSSFTIHHCFKVNFNKERNINSLTLILILINIVVVVVVVVSGLFLFGVCT